MASNVKRVELGGDGKSRLEIKFMVFGAFAPELFVIGPKH